MPTWTSVQKLIDENKRSANEWLKDKQSADCMRVIYLNQIPNACSECVFQSMIPTKYCNLVDEHKDMIDHQICEVDDFVKFLLEVI